VRRDHPVEVTYVTVRKTHEVSIGFKRLRLGKDCGHENVPCGILRDCALDSLR